MFNLLAICHLFSCLETSFLSFFCSLDIFMGFSKSTLELCSYNFIGLLLELFSWTIFGMLACLSPLWVWVAVFHSSPELDHNFYKRDTPGTMMSQSNIVPIRLVDSGLALCMLGTMWDCDYWSSVIGAMEV